MLPNCKCTALIKLLNDVLLPRTAIHTVQNAVQLQMYCIDCSSKSLPDCCKVPICAKHLYSTCDLHCDLCSTGALQLRLSCLNCSSGIQIVIIRRSFVVVSVERNIFMVIFSLQYWCEKLVSKDLIISMITIYTIHVRMNDLNK